MKNVRITMLGSHEHQLKNWLTSHPEGHERGAIVLFRKIFRNVDGLPTSIRFVATEVIEMTDDWIIESSKTHFKFDMRKLPELYFKCESNRLELGFIHNHPNGLLQFSEADDLNEMNILKGLSGCNGQFSFLISLVFSDDKWIGRVRQGYYLQKVIDVRHISVLSDKIELHGISTSAKTPDNLKRQEAAFGKPFNDKLKSLRVAVVGVGGTGSPLATLLGRIGVGEIILIDADILDKTNMNRVRGYVKKDVGKKKASSLRDFIISMGLETSVVSIESYINEDGKAVDAIATCDMVFGCTDDIAGRDLLNQAMYYYGLAYIDLGMAGVVDDGVDGQPYLRSQKGRISCILPEYGCCLRCQNVVNDEKLRAEQAFKETPELRKLDPETLKREYYIVGGGVQAPGIGPFTSATADHAVGTLMNLIKPFRNNRSELRQDNLWIDFTNLEYHSNEPERQADCICCGTKQILLKKEEKYRLDMPSLGKVPRYD